MLSKFVILALTSADPPELSEGTQPADKTGKKKIAWSCARNECRSAGAYIISIALTECFTPFKDKFEISSFGSVEAGEKEVYGGAATDTLVWVLNNKTQEYLDLAKQQLKKELNHDTTESEEKCWREIFSKPRELADKFTSTPPSPDKICVADTSVYAAEKNVKKRIEKLLNSPKYKICAEEHRSPINNIDLMKKGGIADGPWHAKAMVERLMLVKLLKAYPPIARKKLQGDENPFNRNTIKKWDNLTEYTNAKIGSTDDSKAEKTYYATEDEFYEEINELTDENIGFLWHDLVQHKNGAPDIAEEFAPMVKKVSLDVGWNIIGANIVNNNYIQPVVVRQPFFDPVGLKNWLEKNNQALAKEIADAKEEIDVGTYNELVRTLLPAVIGRLKLYTNHANSVLIYPHEN